MLCRRLLGWSLGVGLCGGLATTTHIRWENAQPQRPQDLLAIVDGGKRNSNFSLDFGPTTCYTAPQSVGFPTNEFVSSSPREGVGETPPLRPLPLRSERLDPHLIVNHLMREDKP